MPESDCAGSGTPSATNPYAGPDDRWGDPLLYGQCGTCGGEYPLFGELLYAHPPFVAELPPPPTPHDPLEGMGDATRPDRRVKQLHDPIAEEAERILRMAQDSYTSSAPAYWSAVDDRDRAVWEARARGLTWEQVAKGLLGGTMTLRDGRGGWAVQVGNVRRMWGRHEKKVREGRGGSRAKNMALLGRGPNTNKEEG